VWTYAVNGSAEADLMRKMENLLEEETMFEQNLWKTKFKLTDLRAFKMDEMTSLETVSVWER
jgi:hypothetical protein